MEASSASMLPTKIEIKLKKKEPGSWSRLEILSKVISNKKSETAEHVEENLTSQVDAVDLSDI